MWNYHSVECKLHVIYTLLTFIYLFNIYYVEVLESRALRLNLHKYNLNIKERVCLSLSLCVKVCVHYGLHCILLQEQTLGKNNWTSILQTWQIVEITT